MAKKKPSKKDPASEVDPTTGVDTGDEPGDVEGDGDGDDEDDLERSAAGLNAVIDRLEKGIRTAAPELSREKDLLAKSQAGTATPSERAELAGLLIGSSNDLRERVVASLMTDEMRKSMDGAPFLEGLQAGIVESLGVLADDLAKSQAATRQFNVAVAESQIEMAEALGSLKETVDTLAKALAIRAGAPIRTPRSVDPSATVQPRGFAGGSQREGQNGGEPLSKSLAQAAIGAALQKGVKKIAGRELKVMTALVAGGGALPPQVERELRQYVPK